MPTQDDLEPPDFTRCQAEIRSYNPWVMGGSVWSIARCPNHPHWLLSEVKPRESDGLMGSMCLCDACAAVFIEKQEMPPENYSMEWITADDHIPELDDSFFNSATLTRPGEPLIKE